MVYIKISSVLFGPSPPSPFLYPPSRASSSALSRTSAHGHSSNPRDILIRNAKRSLLTCGSSLANVAYAARAANILGTTKLISRPSPRLPLSAPCSLSQPLLVTSKSTARTCNGYEPVVEERYFYRKSSHESVRLILSPLPPIIK